MRGDTGSHKPRQANPQNQHCGMAWEKHHVEVEIYRNATGHNLLHKGNRQLCIAPKFESSAALKQRKDLAIMLEATSDWSNFLHMLRKVPNLMSWGNKMQKVLFEGEQDCVMQSMVQNHQPTNARCCQERYSKTAGLAVQIRLHHHYPCMRALVEYEMPNLLATNPHYQAQDCL